MLKQDGRPTTLKTEKIFFESLGESVKNHQG
jgi:hypothetical protein